MRTLPLTAVAVLLLAAGVTVAEPTPANRPKPVVVPFEVLKSRHVAVQVKINDRGPFRLIFDTGAPAVILNNRLAREAGLTPKGNAKPSVLFGSGGQVTVKQFAVGDAVADDVKAIIMDHPTVEALAKHLGPIDGIVGFPFFARFRTAVDYQAGTLTLTPNGYKPADIVESITALLMRPGKAEPRVTAAAGVWGLAVEKATGDEADGVVVKAVAEGSPAAAAGLKAGDRLLTIDGRWTDSVLETYQAAAAVPPGRTVEVELRRDGKPRRVPVTPRRGL
jgi:membrane-associated protease RseP (regulator of RpoE activity)